MSAITKLLQFAIKHCNRNCDVNTNTPRIEFVSPNFPLDGRNLEYRNNWEITNVSGIDELADVELSTETTNFRSGVVVKGSRQRERTINVTVRICPCDGDGCDMLQQRRELYEIVKCNWCPDGDGIQCCADGSFCFDDYEVKDKRYCIMRVRCCGVVRDISVVYQSVSTRKLGKCQEYTFTFLAPLVNMHYPRINSAEFTIDPNDANSGLECPNIICFPDDGLDLTTINSFEQCITIPYRGNVPTFPRVVIIGDVLNLRIENADTGETVTLERNGDYRIGGCGATILDFQRGRQSYTDGARENIYSELSSGCNNSLAFAPNCPEGITLCFSGQQVNTDTFRALVQWWDEYDGFTGSADEPEFVAACEGSFVCEGVVDEEEAAC